MDKRGARNETFLIRRRQRRGKAFRRPLGSLRSPTLASPLCGGTGGELESGREDCEPAAHRKAPGTVDEIATRRIL
eukprot:2607402-Rhodomonas_salina.3